jgi:hypothetical protein
MNAKRRGKIIVFGIAFWYPLGGVVYQFLHYLVGLRRLGYDVYYVEDSGRYVYDPVSNDFSPDAWRNIEAVAPVLEAHGLAGKWVFRGNYPGGKCYGMSEGELRELYREADGFLNVTGGQELREEHMKVPRRIYVETDPVVSQIKIAEGDRATIEQFSAHDMIFTYGENIGARDCLLPVGPFEWKTTRQPVVMEFWDGAEAGGEAYTTITTWENKGRDIVYKGETYRWSKHLEFLKILDLPKKAPAPIELAVGVEEKTKRMLVEHGWRIVPSMEISRDFERYRKYIIGSRGEFTVAKDQNVRLRSGWFSDRTACYLAAGRPCVEQTTGFENVLPTGEGLFAFRTMGDIVAAMEIIESDYGKACRAAKEIGWEYFAAEKVLGSLMERAGI